MSILRLWPTNVDEDFWPFWPTHHHDLFELTPWGRHTQPRRQHQRGGGERWTHAVDMRGFNSDDINVRADGDGVIVHGKHEFQDGDNVEKMERRRKVTLPSNVDAGAVTTSLSRNGQLIIQAPLKDAVEPKDDLAEAGFFGMNNDIFGKFPRGFQREGNEVKLRMDLSAYKPDEVNVKVDNHFLKVHAKHADEHSFRESRQSVLLPKGMDESKLASLMSPKGILTFSAPSVEALPESSRTLTIEREEPMAVEK